VDGIDCFLLSFLQNAEKLYRSLNLKMSGLKFIGVVEMRKYAQKYLACRANGIAAKWPEQQAEAANHSYSVFSSQ
jgi:hypothetical protein